MARSHLAALCLPLSACLFPSLAGLAGDGGPSDAGGPDATVDVALPEGGDAADGGGDAADGGGDADGSGLKCFDGGVLASLGSTSVCVDPTEVTVGAYTAFLAAKAGDTSGQPPYCAFNSSYTPGNWPQANASAPVVYVDHCDALAYCAWAGKRLCGGIGGGHATSAQDPANDQWFFVCSHNNDGFHAYPYGNTYGKKTCNGIDYEAGAPVTAGSLSGCVGGFPGVFDMSGNVWEWEDGCQSYDAGATDWCSFRGGAFSQKSTSLTCSALIVAPRSNQFVDVGFRCCAP